MGDLESPEGSLGSWTEWLDPGLPQRRSGVGTRRRLSTPAPWKRSYRSTGTGDSGICTIGTRGLIWTGASGIQETHRMANGDGMVASTPGLKR